MQRQNTADFIINFIFRNHFGRYNYNGPSVCQTGNYYRLSYMTAEYTSKRVPICIKHFSTI